MAGWDSSRPPSPTGGRGGGYGGSPGGRGGGGRGGGGPPLASMSNRLVDEQEILRSLLPATRPHKSSKPWATRQMIGMRFCKKQNAKGGTSARVMCVTPSVLFLVHPIGEVKRFVKMQQVEGYCVSGTNLLVRCARPEHDMLLSFQPDSRNDPNETLERFLYKLTEVKRLRGENLVRLPGLGGARIAKNPNYYGPKRRLDKALQGLRWGTARRRDLEYSDPDEQWQVEEMGKQAGTLGNTNPMATRPTPLPAAAATPTFNQPAPTGPSFTLPDGTPYYDDNGGGGGGGGGYSGGYGGQWSNASGSPPRSPQGYGQSQTGPQSWAGGGDGYWGGG
eukprot:Rhum_TRINITY_DN2138_c0_g1::Rhum_TRINITY_DN2138_c0_g1_i1::g.6111::m.6111